MFQLSYEEEQLVPRYATVSSAGADLRAAEDTVIPPQSVQAVSTGVRIAAVEYAQLPPNVIPELQIRARSGLAARHGICLANGVGTVDADYRDEIKVLLWNTSSSASFTIKRGERIAQLVAALTLRLEQLPVGGTRAGGFGSTGRH